MDLSVEEVHGAVFSALRAWHGFEPLHALMQRYADTRVFLAGGALRDLFRSGRCEPKDFDLFLGGAAGAAFVHELGRFGSLTAGPFGSPRWMPDGESSRYADLILIERFDNGLWPCQDMLDALNQFDFTANAIALDLRQPRLLDPQNGIRDARGAVLRAVRFDFPDEPISPYCPLSRPCVLWFRLTHYAHVLRFEIEPFTRQWLQARGGYARHADEFGRYFFPPQLSQV